MCLHTSRHLGHAFSMKIKDQIKNQIFTFSIYSHNLKTTYRVLGCLFVGTSFVIIILLIGIRIHCPGKPGHGSRFIEDNAAEKVVSILYMYDLLHKKKKHSSNIYYFLFIIFFQRRVINSFLSFRDEQEKK